MEDGSPSSIQSAIQVLRKSDWRIQGKRKSPHIHSVKHNLDSLAYEKLTGKSLRSGRNLHAGAINLSAMAYDTSTERSIFSRRFFLHLWWQERREGFLSPMRKQTLPQKPETGFSSCELPWGFCTKSETTQRQIRFFAARLASECFQCAFEYSEIVFFLCTKIVWS